MKNLTLQLLICVSVFWCQLAFAQQAENGIQQLGQELITALQNNDADNYLKVHLNTADLEEFNKKTAKISKKSAQSLDDAEETLESMEEASQANFEEIIQKGITEQINWKEINYTGIDNIAEMQKEGDLYIIHNPVVRFTYQDKERKLRINKLPNLTGVG